MIHNEEHPSPSWVLLSSHYSNFRINPSPHTVEQLPLTQGKVHPPHWQLMLQGSDSQIAEHPSWSNKFPSSHC